MRPNSLLLRGSKWLGTALCLALFLLFAYSTRRAVTWTSTSLERQVMVMAGGVYAGWRPDTWQLEDDPYAPAPGWSVASHFESRWTWWIRQGTLPKWEWIEFPLWLLIALPGLPTMCLWYRDRRATRRAFRWLIDRLRPSQRRRVSPRLVVSFSIVHVSATICAMHCLPRLRYFFFPAQPPGGTQAYVRFEDMAFVVLFWMTPAWGLVWTYVYVRFINRLGPSANSGRCFECGYNLTGNVSGQCPECGLEI